MTKYLNLEHIASGQIRTGKKQAVILQAFLGTCLGVALYDKTTKTGGMIHILLPEPPGFSAPECEEKYASTGLPILIRQMKELGAAPQNIEATIAGGALVGPISQQDMHLDIGGRSQEVATAILSGGGH